MKAFAIDRYKADLTQRDIPRPEPDANEVLIDIHAASVNPLDGKIQSGEFKMILPKDMPLILGCDLAGVVVRVGNNVTRFQPGDEVYACVEHSGQGTFAECVAVNQACVALKPTNLNMEEAAAIPLVGLTAWQVLVEQARMKAGQSVLWHAGSGGVGSFAIQLARHLGVKVATTASHRNARLVKDLGANVFVDYTKQAFDKELSGYDVAVNTLDSKTLARSVDTLKPGGQLISLSGPPTRAFAREQGLNVFLQFVMSLLSFSIRRKARAANLQYTFLFMRPSGEQLGKITELIESGAIRPVVDRVFAFAQTADALEYVKTGRASGKVVIRIK